MSLFREFLSLRSNVLIVIGGAFLIMFLIKLTSLLPQKFYFSFSSLYGGSEAQPFLIDPPGVSGKKMCDILKKNNINVAELGRQEISCTEGGSQFGGGRFSKEHEDIFYSVAFSTDLEARTKLRNSLKFVKLKPMSDEEFISVMKYNPSQSAVFNSVRDNYRWQIQSQLGKMFTRGMLPAYKGIPDKVEQVTLKAEEVQGPALTELEKQKLLAAHRAFVAGFNGAQLSGPVATAIQKSLLDQFLENPYSKESVVDNIGTHYISTYTDEFDKEIERVFLTQGVNVKDDNSDNKVISVLSQEILQEGLENYVIAILVRVLPVLVFGFIFGLVFGRAELFSIALAGAFAAFLLSWPVILLWDTVVQGSWHQHKDLFLVFYGLYMLSFFFTARVGAMMGAMVRQSMPSVVKIDTPQEPTSDMLKVISWKSLAGNIVTGVLANAAVYAWNVVIPLAT